MEWMNSGYKLPRALIKLTLFLVRKHSTVFVLGACPLYIYRSVIWALYNESKTNE